MKHKILLLNLLLMSMFSSVVYGQTWELGAGVGGAGYMGDLNPDNPAKISGLSGGAFAKLNFSPYWVLGVHYNYGRIKGNDAESSNEQFRSRNLNFKTPLNEVSLQVEFNFFSYFAGGGTKGFTPYIFTGIGGVFFNPKGTYPYPSASKLSEYDLRFYRTEGQESPYRNYALTIPYGVGIKVRLKDNWAMFTQVGYRTAYTDYLDDVSGKYPDPATAWSGSPNAEATSQFLSNPSNPLDPNRPRVGSQRGDSRKRDTYMFVQIGVSYTFLSEKCFTF